MFTVKKENNTEIDNNLDTLRLPTEDVDIEAAVAHVNVPVPIPVFIPIRVPNARIERLNELPGILFIIFLFGCLFVYVFITGFNI